MATVTYTLAGAYPATNTIPQTKTYTNDGAYFYFETDFTDLTILDSISASLTYTQSGGSTSTTWFWSSVKTGSPTSSNSTINNATSNMTTLKNQWTSSRPYLGCRFGCSGTGTINFTGYTISATGRGPKPTVNVGDVITKAQMDALRDYKSNTPTEVTQYAKITNTVGKTYNSSVTQYITINASDYNDA